MVKIEYLGIDTNLRTIQGKILLDEGSTIRTALLYHNERYESKEGMDISSLFIVDGIEVSFTIPSSLIDDTKGLWILEVTTDSLEKVTGVTSDLSVYRECILNKLLSLDIKGCNIVSHTDCNGCGDTTLYAYSILETLIDAIKFGFYTEGLLLLKQLDELCDTCVAPTKDCNCSHTTFSNTIYYG